MAILPDLSVGDWETRVNPDLLIPMDIVYDKNGGRLTVGSSRISHSPVKPMEIVYFVMPLHFGELCEFTSFRTLAMATTYDVGNIQRELDRINDMILGNSRTKLDMIIYAGYAGAGDSIGHINEVNDFIVGFEGFVLGDGCVDVNLSYRSDSLYRTSEEVVGRIKDTVKFYVRGQLDVDSVYFTHLIGIAINSFNQKNVNRLVDRAVFTV